MRICLIGNLHPQLIIKIIKKKLRKQTRVILLILTYSLDIYDDFEKTPLTNHKKSDPNLKIQNEKSFRGESKRSPKKSDKSLKSVTNDLAELIERKKSHLTNTERKSEEIEIEITNEQFLQRVEVFLMNIADHLIKTNQTVRKLFGEKIYYHKLREKEYYEAITLKHFLEILAKNGIKWEDTDVYCIFTKLKFSDQWETIDLQKLLDEMQNFGVFEETNDKPKKQEIGIRIETDGTFITEENNSNLINKSESKDIKEDELSLIQIFTTLKKIIDDFSIDINELLDQNSKVRNINSSEKRVTTVRKFIALINSHSNQVEYKALTNNCAEKIVLGEVISEEFIDIEKLKILYQEKQYNCK